MYHAWGCIFGSAFLVCTSARWSIPLPNAVVAPRTNNTGFARAPAAYTLTTKQLVQSFTGPPVIPISGHATPIRA